MSYSKLVSDTLNIAVKYWWLWIFGFFISASDFGSYTGQISDKIDFRQLNLEHSGLREILPALAVGLVLLILLAALVYLVLMVIAEGSLIVAVRNIKSGKKAGFSSSLSEGMKYFWRILGIWFTTVVVIVAAFLCAAVPIVIGFVIHWVLGLLAVLVVIPLLIALGFAVNIILAWAYRLIVVENMGYLESIGESWALMRNNLGKSIIVGIIAFVSQFLFGIATLILVLLVGIPFLVAGAINLWLGLVPGILIGLTLLMLINGFTGTYASTLWTLAYLEIRNSTTPAEPQPTAA